MGVDLSESGTETECKENFGKEMSLKKSTWNEKKVM